MLIVCPTCASEYIIDPTRIGAAGRSVRCAACREAFFVVGGPEVTREERAGTEKFNTLLASPAWPQRAAGLTVARPDDGAGEPVRAGRGRWKPSLALSGLAARLRGVPGGIATTALLMIVSAALVAGREKIVAVAPAAARLYAAVKLPVNPSGLALKAVRSEVVVDGADRLLVVEGEILNVASKAVEVPRLELSVRGPDGLPLYTWTNEAPRKTLGATESARFRARLASPPSEGREVLVRFAQAPGRSSVSARAP
jgi:predicted Zn finger-like uncharacterized protein